MIPFVSMLRFTLVFFLGGGTGDGASAVIPSVPDVPVGIDVGLARFVTFVFET